MTTTLSPYSFYERSGVDWLCDVPEHWEVRRLRTIAEVRTSNVDKHIREDEVPIRLCNYVDVYKNDWITQSIQFMNVTASENEIERFRLELGDVLITKDSETWDDIGVPALVTEPADDLLAGYHLALLRPFKIILGAFLARALLSKGVAYQLHVRANGVTRYGLTHVNIQSVHVPLPPLNEQAAIVRYLDYVDRRIHRYVDAKRKLIALLKEEKQAVVNQAVTRGLDPNVRLKHSGVEWIGAVPEHWKVSRVKTEFLSLNHRRVPLSAVERGAMDVRRYDYYGASGVIDRVEDYLFDDELLLIAEDGANLKLRNLPLAIIARGRFWVNNHAHILKPRRGSLEYLAVVMERLNYDPWISGAAQPKLTQDRLMNIPIAVPPRTEQDDIITRTRAQTSGLTIAIARTRRQIELVEEYRTKLIADVVTGKLDVREAADQAE